MLALLGLGEVESFSAVVEGLEKEFLFFLVVFCVDEGVEKLSAVEFEQGYWF